MAEVRHDLRALETRLGALAKAAPEVARGFDALSTAATAEGSLTTAQKELVAVAIAVSQGCEGCILYHVDAAIRHGATRDGLVEMLAVAVEIGGGPAMVYASRALEAFDGLA